MASSSCGGLGECHISFALELEGLSSSSGRLTMTPSSTSTSGGYVALEWSCDTYVTEGICELTDLIL